MRRTLLALVTVAFILVPLGSAHAQEAGLRDPFDPLLSVEGETTSPTDPGDTSDPAVVTEPDTDPDVATDGLPATGQDPRGWLAFAYVLLAVGGTLVALSRLSTESRRI